MENSCLDKAEWHDCDSCPNRIVIKQSDGTVDYLCKAAQRRALEIQKRVDEKMTGAKQNVQAAQQ